MDQLVIDQPAFSANFQRRPFYIQHRLGDHPLFQFPSLAELSGRLPKPMVEWNAGHAGAYGKQDEIRPAELPCAQTIPTVGERPAWVLLRHVESDPLYKDLLDGLLDRLHHSQN